MIDPAHLAAAAINAYGTLTGHLPPKPAPTRPETPDLEMPCPECGTLIDWGWAHVEPGGGTDYRPAPCSHDHTR